MGEPKAHALYHRFRDDLVAGAWTPGDRISETEVAARYGMSRTPVREALARLEVEGLLARAGHVVTVPAPSVAQVLDLFDARIVLESALARHAAERHREADILVLQGAADRCRALGASPRTTAMYHANRDFHHALGAASQNEVIAGLQRQLDMRVAALRATTLTVPGRWDAALDQHDAIVAAVAAGDRDAAAMAAERHLRDARELWLRLLTATPMTEVT